MVDGLGGRGVAHDEPEFARTTLSMTNRETEDLEFYLGEMNISIANIGNLEDLLNDKLDRLEEANIEMLLSHSTMNQMEIIGDRIDQSVAKAQEMSMWMEMNDSELSKMKDKIKKIEDRNLKLETQEQNYQKLHNTLESILQSFKLTQEHVSNLEKSDLNNNYDATLEAAEALDVVLRTKLRGGLADIASVQVLVAQNLKLRNIFVSHASKFIMQRLKENSVHVIRMNWPLVTQHENLRKYKDLMQLVQNMAPAQCNELRNEYTANYKKLHEACMKKFFASLKCKLSTKKFEVSFTTLPEWDDSMFRKMRTDFKQNKFSRHKASQMPITSAFALAVATISEVCLEEQKFVLHFFGSQPLYNDEAPNKPGKLERKVSFAFAGAEDGSDEDEDESENSDNEEMKSPRRNKNGIFRRDSGALPGKAELQSSPEDATTMLTILFKGLHEELKDFVDIGYRRDPYDCLNMLVASEEVKGCAYLAEEMDVLHDLLSRSWHEFIDGQIRWIDCQKPTVKHAGVLMPVSKFPSLIEIMEGANGRTKVADDTYIQIGQALSRWLDRLASRETKYGSLVLLENHAFIYDVVRQYVEQIPILKEILEASAKKMQENLQRYALWNIVYEMPRIFRLWDTLDEALKTVSVDAVQFTGGLTKHDLRQSLQRDFTRRKLTKRLRGAYYRIQKHIPDNDKLIARVWETLQGIFLQKYKTFENLIEDCYQNEKMLVSCYIVEKEIIPTIPSTARPSKGVLKRGIRRRSKKRKAKKA